MRITITSYVDVIYRLLLDNVYVYCIVPLQPNGAEEIYGMDQLSKFEEEKMKEVNKEK